MQDSLLSPWPPSAPLESHGNAPASPCVSPKPHRAEETQPLCLPERGAHPFSVSETSPSASLHLTEILPVSRKLGFITADVLSWGGQGGAAKIPKEASLDNVSFLHFLTAAPWGMTNSGKMLLMSRDKNYDYLLGCHPPWGILARDITPLFLLVPRARWDPDCSMVKGLSCLLTPCFQTVRSRGPHGMSPVLGCFVPFVMSAWNSSQ